MGKLLKKVYLCFLPGLSLLFCCPIQALVHVGANIHIGSGGHYRPRHGWGWGWGRPYYDDGFGVATGALIGGMAGAAIASRPPEDPKERFERKATEKAIRKHEQVEREIKKIEKLIRKEETALKKERRKQKSAKKGSAVQKKSISPQTNEISRLQKKLKGKKSQLKKLALQIRGDEYDDNDDDDDDNNNENEAA